MRRNLLIALLVGASALAAPYTAGAEVADVPNSVGVYDYSFAMNPDGQYVLAWDTEGRWTQGGPLKVVNGTLGEPMALPQLVGGKTSAEPYVRVGPEGTRVVQWLNYYSTRKPPKLPTAAVWPAAASPVAPPEMLPLGFGGDYEADIGPQGQLASTGIREGRRESVMYATRGPGGVISPPRAVHTASADGGPFEPSVSFDAAGVPTLYWSNGSVACGNLVALRASRCKAKRSAIYAANSDGAGGFLPPQRIVQGCEGPTIGAAPSGAVALLAWCDRGLRYTERAPGQPFGPTRRISPGRSDVGIADMELLPDGRVIVVFELSRRLDEERWETHLVASAGVLGGPLSAPIRITRNGVESPVSDTPQPTPRLLIGANSQPYLRWYGRKGLRLAALGADLKLGPALLFPDRELETTEVALTNRGDGLAVYYARAGKRAVKLVADHFSAPPVK
ncbi:MAG: hypothetical protein ACRDKI_10150 [Solirubrobacterales bacterium]